MKIMKKLIKAIQQASSAISKCNANGFDGAIQKIPPVRFKSRYIIPILLPLSRSSLIKA